MQGWTYCDNFLNLCRHVHRCSCFVSIAFMSGPNIMRNGVERGQKNVAVTSCLCVKRRDSVCLSLCHWVCASARSHTRGCGLHMEVTYTKTRRSSPNLLASYLDVWRTERSTSNYVHTPTQNDLPHQLFPTSWFIVSFQQQQAYSGPVNRNFVFSLLRPTKTL